MKANSRVTSGAYLLLSLLPGLAGPQQTEATYGFATERYDIEMRVDFPVPYVGRRLVFYNGANPQKELCYSGNGGTLGKCPERFVGALAVVRYSVRHQNGKPVGRITIREHVTVMAESRGLPYRLPFSKSIELVNGIGSDLQVFGYDESEVRKSERIRARRQASQTMWRLFDRNSTSIKNRTRSLLWSGCTLSITSVFTELILRVVSAE
jgi:hypothetical protein